MSHYFKKKNTIISEAIKLFSKQGFYKTKLSEVSSNIGISVGNIYGYFPSKKSLAKASIKYVAHKLGSELKYINNQDISQREKLEAFITIYFNFTQNYPEMIEYFFRVYLANRELFQDEKDCGFSLAKEFIDELEQLVDDGIENGEFKEQNFYIAFAVICGTLGAITFLEGENALKEDLDIYRTGTINAIYKAIS